MPARRIRLATAGVLGTAVVVGALATSPAAASAAAVTVTPSTGLTDGQTVAVSGTGYVAGSEIGVSECVRDTVCSETTVHTTAGADGTFAVDYVARKQFTATDWSTGETVTVDCAVEQCQVVAWEQEIGPIGQPISFG